MCHWGVKPAPIQLQYELELIDASIERWKKIVYHHGGIDLSNYCPLCEHYPADCYRLIHHKSVLVSISKCPVFEFTGLPECDGTTYYDTGSFPFRKDKTAAERRIAANLMLSLGYSIRLWWINKKNAAIKRDREITLAFNNLLADPCDSE